MSNFQCGKCGAMCYDTHHGYITGCQHHPPDRRPTREESDRIKATFGWLNSNAVRKYRIKSTIDGSDLT